MLRLYFGCVLRRTGCGVQFRRCHSTTGKPIATQMSAWQIHHYGGLKQLELSSTLRVPPLMCPTDVLVEVHATSVNPIDTRMIDGYGSSTLNVLRRLTGQPEFPLTPGRDFSGRVVAVGGCVSDLQPGDLVWGTTPVHSQGTHAQYTLVPSYAISLKPSSLTHVEAASLPYAAATAWSALVVTAELWSERARRDQRVLVVGAAGGVGSCAVQLLKAWGCEVTATCSTDSVSAVESLGADVVIDYTAENAEETLNLLKGFNVILDCSGCHNGTAMLPLLNSWTYAKYVTLDSPLLKNVDAEGLLAGSVRNAARLVQDNLTSHSMGRSVRWAFYMPNGYAMKAFKELVDDGKVRPFIQRVVPFTELPEAYQQVMDGHNRGKTVISVTSHESHDDVIPPAL